jgi:hypothetical protein
MCVPRTYLYRSRNKKSQLLTSFVPLDVSGLSKHTH